MNKLTNPDDFDADLTSVVIDGLLEIADEEELIDEEDDVRINLESGE